MFLRRVERETGGSLSMQAPLPHGRHEVVMVRWYPKHSADTQTRRYHSSHAPSRQRAVLFVYSRHANTLFCFVGE